MDERNINGDDVRLMARAAGLAKALADFSDDIFSAAAQAASDRRLFSPPSEAIVEPWNQTFLRKGA